MKKLLTILLTVFSITVLFAQSPQKMSYQAIIRNVNNNIVINHSVGIRISIMNGTNPVYVETQTPTTNASGLINIEIGGGTFVSGVAFASIDWSAASYSLKTETDPTGGTDYAAIVGTSPLLSVPYALYAKTSGSVVAHYPGERYGGGVVFWVDGTGQHGLICSMIDLSTSQVWSNITTAIGTTAQSDWDGNSNSTAITTQSGHTSSAAKLCLDYTNADYGTGVYSDWYLPSRGELNDLWNNLKAVQKALDSDGNASTTAIAKENYWSSSESDRINSYSHGDTAWAYFFQEADMGDQGKDSKQYVRAVRAF